MTEQIAQLKFAAGDQDAALIAARSAGIWVGLSIDENARAVLRRDGIDAATLRLSGPHPFQFEAAADGEIIVRVEASDKDAAEALLDLFRIYFLRRLTA